MVTGNDTFRVNGLIRAIKHLPQSLRPQAFRYAFDALPENDKFFAFEIGILADACPECWEEADFLRCVEKAGKMATWERARVLSNLAPFFSRFGRSDLLESTLEAATRSDDQEDRTANFTSLLPILTDDGRRPLISKIMSGGCDSNRSASALVKVIEYMNDSERSDVVSCALKIGMSSGDISNWFLLHSILFHLDGETRDKTVNFLFHSALEYSHDHFASVLPHLLPLVPQPAKLKLIGAICRSSSSPRSSFYRAIGSAGPALSELGGDALVLKTMAVLDESADWWP